jgi:hypothetical protein
MKSLTVTCRMPIEKPRRARVGDLSTWEAARPPRLLQPRDHVDTDFTRNSRGCVFEWFRSPAERAAFSSELTNAIMKLVARYHDEAAPGGRAYRLVVVAHPLPGKAR